MYIFTMVTLANTCNIRKEGGGLVCLSKRNWTDRITDSSYSLTTFIKQIIQRREKTKGMQACSNKMDLSKQCHIE